MPRPRFQLLTDVQVERIIEEAFSLLETFGLHVSPDAGREILESKGLQRNDKGRYPLSRNLIEEALDSAPKRITMHGRDGGRELVLGDPDASPVFDPGSAAVRVVEPDGTMRSATLRDAERLAILTEALPAYAMQSTGLVPSDVPQDKGDLHRMRTALVNCRKPIVTGTVLHSNFQAMYGMLCTVRGSGEGGRAGDVVGEDGFGQAALRERPLAIFDACPTGPLSWHDPALSDLISCAAAGIPVDIVSMPIPGMNAPMSLMAGLVQHTAECLSGIALTQFVDPGAPVLFGGAPAMMDLRTGVLGTGAPETDLLVAGYTEVARSLGMPVHGYLGGADSKSHDPQAGVESMGGVMSAYLCGMDLCSGGGLLEGYLSLSLEKLLSDAETIGIAGRFARGVDDISLDEPLMSPLEDFQRDGQLISHPHTMKGFREELHFPGKAWDRYARGGEPEGMGDRSMVQRLSDHVEILIEDTVGVRLDDDVVSRLDTFIT